MSAMQRSILSILTLMLLISPAVAQQDPDAPDRASEVLEILTRSKKIAEKEKKSGETSKAKSEDKTEADDKPQKTEDTVKSKSNEPSQREPNGDASSQAVTQIAVPARSDMQQNKPQAEQSEASDANAADDPDTPANAQPAEPASKPRRPATTEYTIQSGDTFSSIAKQLYGDEKKWTAIAQANPLVDPARLKVGQTIRLPDLEAYAKQRDEQLEAIKQAVSKPAGGEAKTVVVQPGDTLSHIARRVYGNGNLWSVIFQANQNQMATPDKLQVGMKLVVPPKPKDG